MKTQNERRGTGHYFSDPSFHAIILGNLLTIIMAYIEHWSLGEVMLIYWCQSVIIGLVNFYRMVTLKKFSTQGLKMNDRPVPETAEAKKQVAVFFLAHYGFFHAAYFMFLVEDQLSGLESAAMTLVDKVFIAGAILGFAGSHIYSHSN